MPTEPTEEARPIGRPRQNEDVMLIKCVRLLPVHTEHISITNQNLSEGLRRLIDIDRARQFRVEVDSLTVPDTRQDFPTRWQAEQFAEETFSRLQATDGSVYLTALVDGRDVMIREYSLNAAQKETSSE